MRRRRGISFGTIAMLLIACITLGSTFGVIMAIRKDEGNLSMDAEKLLASVSELMVMSQRHANPGPQSASAVSVTTVPSTALPAEAVHNTESVQGAVITPEPSTVPSQRHTLNLTFGGSVALESSVISGAAYQYSDILSRISPAVHADLNFVILETLFTAGNISQRDLIAPLDSLQAVTSAGFDTAILGAQNALAGGATMAKETLEALSANGIRTAGLYTAENYRPYEILQINGLQVAVLTYTESLSAASKRAVSDEATQKSMVHIFDLNAACTDVAAARAQGADLVLVFLHWGMEDATEPDAAQKKIAQALSNAGVDLLLGYNCRNVQPVDFVQSNSDPGHQMLTAWSLGTLVSEDRDTRAVVSGALVHVQLTQDDATGAINFDKVEYTPTYCWRQEENGLYPYRVVLSNQSVPEGMIQKQREIIARALVLIQTTMNKGIAVQR